MVFRPEDVPRLFDLVIYKDDRLKGAFYYALRDTLVAKDLTQASRIAFGMLSPPVSGFIYRSLHLTVHIAIG